MEGQGGEKPVHDQGGPIFYFKIYHLALVGRTLKLFSATDRHIMFGLNGLRVRAMDTNTFISAPFFDMDPMDHPLGLHLKSLGNKSLNLS